MVPRVSMLRCRPRGWKINRKRVTRLIRVNNIVGRHLRRKKRTTIADTTAPPASDLMMRGLHRGHPERQVVRGYHLHSRRSVMAATA
jgi:hypothetical protein